MNRNTARRLFSISTAPNVVEIPLTSEKNKLLSLMNNYLKKKTNRITTVTELNTLHSTLSGIRTTTSVKPR